MKRLSIFESVDINTEQAQHLIKAIKTFYEENKDINVRTDFPSHFTEDMKLASTLEIAFKERYELTNFNDIIQHIISQDKEFIYHEFLKNIKNNQ